MGRRKPRTRWYEWAACAGMNTEHFFPLGDGPATARAMEAAKRVCGRCPVRWECLADAMAHEEPDARYGVLGGLSPAERTALARNQAGEAA